jgi:hypothetical protein
MNRKEDSEIESDAASSARRFVSQTVGVRQSQTGFDHKSGIFSVAGVLTPFDARIEGIVPNPRRDRGQIMTMILDGEMVSGTTRFIHPPIHPA